MDPVLGISGISPVGKTDICKVSHRNRPIHNHPGVAGVDRIWDVQGDIPILVSFFFMQHSSYSNVGKPFS